MVMIKCCYDVEKLLDSDKYEYIEDDLFWKSKILKIDGKLYGVIVYNGRADKAGYYTDLINNKYKKCKILDLKWDFDDICTVLYLIGEYRLKTLAEVWEAIAKGEYLREEWLHTALVDKDLIKKFHNRSKYFIDGEWYAILCNGSNGKENSITRPMEECLALLYDVTREATIIDSYFDTTDDVYNWLFWIR